MIFDDNLIWLVVVGFIVAFILAFGLGANDVANSFGTSVGAKVITIRQACILGSIFEILGAILVGAKVSNTIRKGIIDPSIFTNGTEDVFMAGNCAALTGSCIWLIAATFLKLPVSGTHSIVGATIGFSVVVNGFKGIGWAKLGMIAGSWVISPLLSGLVSTLLFKFIDILVLRKPKPLEPGLKLLPVFYALTVAVNLFSVFYKGSQLLHFHKIPLYGVFILTFGPALIIAVFVRIFIVPRQRKKILDHCKRLVEEGEYDQEPAPAPSLTLANVANQTIVVSGAECKKANGEADPLEATFVRSDEGSEIDHVSESDMVVSEGYDTDPKDEDNVDSADDKQKKKRDDARNEVSDKPETAGLFTFLQVLTAIFGSFAHGGNDVSNAIGPLVALWVTGTSGSTAQSAPVPIWVLVYGGVGISVGLWIWGSRVMKTMGEDLTKITPSSGFCIEVGSALTVIVASNVGIPISTTHCKVGSVVCVGRVRSSESVDWKLFRNIILAWCVTLPVSGGLSALAMYGFTSILKVT